MFFIRIGLVRDSSFASSGMSNAGATASHWAAALGERSHSSGAAPRRGPNGLFEMRDLKVDITQVVEDDDVGYGASEHRAGGQVSLTRADVRAEPVDLEVAEEDDSGQSSLGLQGASKAGIAV